MQNMEYQKYLQNTKIIFTYPGAYSVFVVANVHAVCLVSHFFISLLNALIARNEEYSEYIFMKLC